MEPFKFYFEGAIQLPERLTMCHGLLELKKEKEKENLKVGEEVI